MPFKTFIAETLTAADVNNYLMRQTVIRLASTSQLTGIPSPEFGMRAFVSANGYTYEYDGSTWVKQLRIGTPQAVTFNAGYKNFNAAYPVQVFERHGIAYLRGLIAPDSGTIAASFTGIVANLPAGFAPAQAAFAAAYTPVGTTGAGLRIGTGGDIQIMNHTTAINFAGVDGISWAIA